MPYRLPGHRLYISEQALIVSDAMVVILPFTRRFWFLIMLSVVSYNVFVRLFGGWFDEEINVITPSDYNETLLSTVVARPLRLSDLTRSSSREAQLSAEPTYCGRRRRGIAGGARGLPSGAARRASALGVAWELRPRPTHGRAPFVACRISAAFSSLLTVMRSS